MADTDREGRRAAVLAAFRQQVDWCRSLGSPFTAVLLEALAAEIATTGIGGAMFGDRPGDPVADALALRAAGALHALVLSGAAPDLAACYPPELPPPVERLRAVLPGVLERHRPFVDAFLVSPPQTNEVGRSAVLLGGFLQIAADTRLPLLMLEIGASAGLNTIWDRYAYRLGEAAWGDPGSPVRLAPDWHGPLPPLDAPLVVAGRRACDVAPVDLDDAGERLRLKAFVWADQSERLARLDGAIALARVAGHAVERADAGNWVAERLAEPTPGCTTVLFHSIMWQYMPAPTRDAITQSVGRAAARATDDAPLAWLRFEPVLADRAPDLRLTLWPGGTDRHLASAQAHGRRIDWVG